MRLDTTAEQAREAITALLAGKDVFRDVPVLSHKSHDLSALLDEIAAKTGARLVVVLLSAKERGGQVTEAGRGEEREADAFAAELLMPEPLVRQAAREHGADVDRLADRFDVSRSAMRNRLQRLDILERHGS